MIARPVVGLSKPATMLRSVLFPQPDGPTIATNSPAPIARLIACSACTAALPVPNRFVAASIRSLAPLTRDAAERSIDWIAIGDRCVSDHLRQEGGIDIRREGGRNRAHLLGGLEEIRLGLERTQHAGVFRARQSHPFVACELLRRDRVE